MVARNRGSWVENDLKYLDAEPLSSTCSATQSSGSGAVDSMWMTAGALERRRAFYNLCYSDDAAQGSRNGSMIMDGGFTP